MFLVGKWNRASKHQNTAGRGKAAGGGGGGSGSTAGLGGGDDSTTSMDPFKTATDLRGGPGCPESDRRQRSASLTRSFYRCVQKPHYDMQHYGGGGGGGGGGGDRPEHEGTMTPKTPNNRPTTKGSGRRHGGGGDKTGPLTDQTKTTVGMDWTATKTPKTLSLSSSSKPHFRHDLKENIPPTRLSLSKQSSSSPYGEYYNHNHRYDNRNPFHQSHRLQQHRRSKSLEHFDYAYYYQHQFKRKQPNDDDDDDELRSHPSDQGQAGDAGAVERPSTPKGGGGGGGGRFELPSFMSGLTHDSDFDNDNETIKKDNKSTTKKKKRSSSRVVKSQEQQQHHHHQIWQKEMSSSHNKRSEMSSDRYHRRSRSLGRDIVESKRKSVRSKEAPVGIVCARKSDPWPLTEASQFKHGTSPGHVNFAQFQKQRSSRSNRSRSRTRSKSMNKYRGDSKRSIPSTRRGRSKDRRNQKTNSAWNPNNVNRSPREPSPGTGIDGEGFAAEVSGGRFIPRDFPKQGPSPSCVPFRPSPPPSSMSEGVNYRCVSMITPEPVGVRLDAIQQPKYVTSNDMMATATTTPVEKLTLSAISKASYSGIFPIDHHPANHQSPTEKEPAGRRLDAEFSEDEVQKSTIDVNDVGGHRGGEVSQFRPVTTSFPSASPLRDDESEGRYALPILPVSRSRSLNRFHQRGISVDSKERRARGTRSTRRRPKSLPRKLGLNESYQSYDWSAKGYTLEDHCVTSYEGRIKWPASLPKRSSSDSPRDDALRATKTPGDKNAKPFVPAEADSFRRPSDFRGIEIITQPGKGTRDRGDTHSWGNGNRIDPALTLTSISDVTDESEFFFVDGNGDIYTHTAISKQNRIDITSPRDVIQAHHEFAIFNHNDSQEMIKTRSFSSSKQHDGLRNESKNRASNGNGKKSQIRLVTQEAARHSLLTPLGGDESISLADDNLIDGAGQIDHKAESGTSVFADAVRTPTAVMPVTSRSPMNVQADKALGSLSSARRKELIANYLVSRVQVPVAEESGHQLHLQHEATDPTEESPATSSKHARYARFKKEHHVSKTEKSKKGGAPTVDPPSVLTAERDDGNCDLLPFSPWVQKVEMEDESSTGKYGIDIQDSIRRVKDSGGASKLQPLESGPSDGSLCLGTFGIRRFHARKRNQVAGGYVNLSLNESATSSVCIDRKDNIDTMPGKKSETGSIHENATAFTPTTLASSNRDRDECINNGMSSSLKVRKDMSYPSKSRINVETFSVEQLEI